MKLLGEGTVKFQCGNKVYEWEPLRIDTEAYPVADEFICFATIILEPDTQLPEPGAEGIIAISVGNFSTGEAEAKVLEIRTVSDAKDAPVVCKIAYRKSM